MPLNVITENVSFCDKFAKFPVTISRNKHELDLAIVIDFSLLYYWLTIFSLTLMITLTDFHSI